MLNIVIPLRDAQFPNASELEMRSRLEDSLLNLDVVKDVSVGAGLGFMELSVAIANHQEATQIKDFIQGAFTDLLPSDTTFSIDSSNTQNPSKELEQVVPGRLFAALIDKDKFAIGIVLHVSKVFPQLMMVGFYDVIMQNLESFDESSLGRFIGTPCYVNVTMILDGEWELLNHSAQLLSEANIPHLRVAFEVYYKDDVVKGIPLASVQWQRILSVNGIRKYLNKTYSPS